MSHSGRIVSDLESHAVRLKDRVAYRDHTGKRTYAELLSDLRAFIAGLASLQLRAGDRVAWVMAPDKEYQDVLSALACTILGVEFCHVPPGFVETRSQLLKDIGVGRYLLPPGRVLEAWDQGWGPLEQVTVPAKAEGIDLSGLACDDDAPYRIVFSSGSTGQPKSIQIARARMGWDGSMPSADRFEPDDVLLNLFSAFVSPGLGRQLMQAFVSGVSVAYFPPGHPERLWREVGSSGVTIIASPVMVFSDLIKHSPSKGGLARIKQINLLGARCPRELLDQIRAVTAASVVNDYGATEVGAVASGEITVEGIESGLAGQVLPEVEVQVVDEVGQQLPYGVDGVVRIRAPHMSTGYIGVARHDAFRDGWFYCGDRGRLTEDGLLYINDREGDVVNMGGWKISLRALDDLFRSVPGVMDCCAFAVVNADGIQEPWLAVVAPPFLDLKSLFQLAEERQTFIGGVWSINTVPRSNGKPQRWKVAEAFRSQQANSAE